MKKILIVFILLYGQLSGFETESTLNMYHHVFSALTQKSSIRVYTQDAKYRKVFALSKRLVLASDPYQADVVLVTDGSILNEVLTRSNSEEDVDTRPVLFATDYRLLKESKDIVGAFYWRKGRSQLLFVKNRLVFKHIQLPAEYNKYLIDEI